MNDDPEDMADDEPAPELWETDGAAWKGREPEPAGLEDAVAIIGEMLEDARSAPLPSERDCIVREILEGLDVIAYALRESLEAFDWLAVERLLREPRS